MSAAESEEVAQELSPRLALLFGHVKPARVPEGAPRRTNRLRHEDHADELEDGEPLPTRPDVARGRRAQILAWLKAGKVPRTTSECGELVMLSSQTVVHDLMALERAGRVERGFCEVERATRPGRRTVQTWSFVK